MYIYMTGITVSIKYLLLVLVDFLEVLVCINFQLAACSFVASNDSVGMKLECTDGPCMIYAAFYAMTKCTCLAVTVDKKENLLGVANGTNTDRKSGLRNLIGIVVKETGVNDQSVFGQSTNAGTGYKRGVGLIECNVAVNAAAA